jgi:hypothetical protein
MRQRHRDPLGVTIGGSAAEADPPGIGDSPNEQRAARCDQSEARCGGSASNCLKADDSKRTDYDHEGLPFFCDTHEFDDTEFLGGWCCAWASYSAQPACSATSGDQGSGELD